MLLPLFEYWNLLNFLDPEAYSSFHSFAAQQKTAYVLNESDRDDGKTDELTTVSTRTNREANRANVPIVISRTRAEILLDAIGHAKTLLPLIDYSLFDIRSSGLISRLVRPRCATDLFSADFNQPRSYSATIALKFGASLPPPSSIPSQRIDKVTERRPRPAAFHVHTVMVEMTATQRSQYVSLIQDSRDMLCALRRQPRSARTKYGDYGGGAASSQRKRDPLRNYYLNDTEIRSLNMLAEKLRKCCIDARMVAGGAGRGGEWGNDGGRALTIHCDQKTNASNYVLSNKAFDAKLHSYMSQHAHSMIVADMLPYSGKLVILDKLLNRCKEQNQRVVIISQYRYVHTKYEHTESIYEHTEYISNSCTHSDRILFFH